MENPIKFITKGDLTYLIFSKWENDSHLTHCFTTKSSGVSKGHLASLNLGFNRGDRDENVLQNYRNVCTALEVPFESIVLSKQVHEMNIAKVTAKDKGNGIIRANQWESIDGIYTQEKGITLVTHYADCVPLFFYAPKYGMIGMCHAGWRGTVGKIGENMIKIWHEQEGIPLEAIQVAIGPSIGLCCFQVGKEVADIFLNTFGEASFIQKDEVGQKYHIDLWACNKHVLKSSGILEENIIVSGICTCCHDKIFFSHRKTQGMRGTLGAFMTLKD